MRCPAPVSAFFAEGEQTTYTVSLGWATAV